MPKSEVLYCKGMNVAQSETDGDEPSGEDKWDDTELNSAYDKALKMANVEVAKRLAMATNSKHEGKDHSNSKHSSKKHQNKKKWSAGMPCRAIYEGDGLEYEAFVLQILNEKECIVKFLGYDNSEQVETATMKPSLGKEAQQRQVEQTLIEREEDSDASLTVGTDREGSCDREQSLGSTVRLFHKKDSRKKKRQPQQRNSFRLPEIPLPNMSKLRNMASMDIPIPPPMPFPSAGLDDCEEQAVSSMLLSWYMSGYYTGLYQGLKRSKPNKRHKD